jgi:hypothetical protein
MRKDAALLPLLVAGCIQHHHYHHYHQSQSATHDAFVSVANSKVTTAEDEWWQDARCPERRVRFSGAHTVSPDSTPDAEERMFVRDSYSEVATCACQSDTDYRRTTLEQARTFIQITLKERKFLPTKIIFYGGDSLATGKTSEFEATAQTASGTVNVMNRAYWDRCFFGLTVQYVDAKDAQAAQRFLAH